jgi:hypothetical protein
MLIRTLMSYAQAGMMRVFAECVLSSLPRLLLLLLLLQVLRRMWTSLQLLLLLQLTRHLLLKRCQWSMYRRCAHMTVDERFSMCFAAYC